MLADEGIAIGLRLIPTSSVRRTVCLGANRVSSRYSTTTIALSAAISVTRMASKNEIESARDRWSISQTMTRANGGHLTIVVVT